MFFNIENFVGTSLYSESKAVPLRDKYMGTNAIVTFPLWFFKTLI